MLNFNHLYYFYTFVVEGSVVRAARKLQISQPALSAQLRQFESKLGEPLFARAGRNLEITARGRLVFGYARQMFALSDELQAELRDTRESDKSRSARMATITLGVVPELDASVALEVLAPALKPDSGGPRLSLTSASHDELLDRLQTRLVDAVISNHPIFDERFEAIAQIKAPVRVAVSSSFVKRFGEKKQTLERNVLGALKIFKTGFVLPSAGLKLRGETDRFLEEIKTTPQIALETDSIPSIARAVAEGYGVAFLPVIGAPDPARRRELHYYGPVAGFWQHSIWLLARKGSPVVALLKELAP